MRAVFTPWMSLPVAVLSAALAGPAPGADHDSPLSASTNVYPSGSDISQNFSQPEPAAAMIPDAIATDGHVSGAAAMSHLLSQPPALALAGEPMTHTLKSRTRVRLTPADGRRIDDAPAPALYKFTYGMHYRGIPLWKYSSRSQIIQARGDRRKLLFLRERNMPRPGQVGEMEANVRPEDATRAGLDDAREATRAPIVVDPRDETPHREIHVDANGKATLAWAFVVRSTDRARPFARRYWVTARDQARVITREDLIYHLDAPAGIQQGKVAGTFFGIRKSPFDPPSSAEGLNDFTVATGSSAVVTDANGFFSLSGPATLSRSLAGPFCRIIDEAGRPLAPTREGINITFVATSPEQLAQVSAFKWVSTAHAFVKDFLPTHADRLAGLPTHVNIDETCNAFFDPGEHTLNFFKAGDGCVNTAYCDVACHEFGHAVDDQFDEILDGGYSEGFGDALAMLITRDSIVGRDFKGRGNHLRNGQDVVTWPPQNPEVHAVGRIYGGFAWELIRQLKAKLGDEDRAYEAARDLILGAAALNPKDTPDAVRLSFLVDNQNGSPFFQQLSAAADSRHIPRPDSPEAVQSPGFLAAGSR